MSWLSRFLRSTIGQKLVMAVSGLLLVGFVIAHMVGNLQIFLPDGGAALNEYAAMLQGNKGVLWAARLGLLGAVGAHIWSAFKLTRSANAARANSRARRGHREGRGPRGARGSRQPWRERCPNVSY